MQSALVLDTGLVALYSPATDLSAREASFPDWLAFLGGLALFLVLALVGLLRQRRRPWIALGAVALAVAVFFIRGAINHTSTRGTLHLGAIASIAAIVASGFYPVRLFEFPLNDTDVRQEVGVSTQKEPADEDESFSASAASQVLFVVIGIVTIVILAVVNPSFLG